jgi:hypothetical protein
VNSEAFADDGSLSIRDWQAILIGNDSIPE